nr:asparagine synthase (glutamine-hydrolyzing) [Marininema halotolerans]
MVGFHIKGDRYQSYVKLKKCTGSLVHRGPDSEGIYLDDFMALGMRRLSIRDLAFGEQPYYNERKNVVVVFNGEIYNNDRLRCWLESRGHTIDSQSDGAILPHLYEEKGERLFEELDGMFALAIWDAEKKILLLSVDSAGIKPLYYTIQSDNEFVFASEIKTIHQFDKRPFELDPSAIGSYLLFKSIPTPYTPYKKIRKLKPGEVLIYKTQDQKLVRKYFQPHVSTITDPFKEFFYEQVRTTMLSDVKVGCIASGGLDSNLVLKAMAEQMDEPVPVFTVGYPIETEDDERIYAQQMTKEVNGHFHSVLLNPLEVPEMLEEVIWHLDEPNQDPITLPYYALMREVKEHCKVVLTGDGSDEFFGGYSRFHHWDKNVGLDVTQSQYISDLLLFSDTQLKEILILQNNAWEPYAEPIQQLNQVRSLKGAMEWEQKFRLPSYHLNRVDKLSMAWGVEARVPFLRPSMIAQARLLSTGDLRIDGVEKVWLKDQASQFMPRWLIERKKKPFTFPMQGWMRDQWKNWIYETLFSSNSIICNFVHKNSLLSIWNMHQKGADYSHHLWSFIVLETFLQLQKGSFNSLYQDQRAG